MKLILYKLWKKEKLEDSKIVQTMVIDRWEVVGPKTKDFSIIT